MKKTLVAAASLFALASAHADPQAVTVILNSSSTMTQGIALVLSNQMQAQGAKVHVLLCDKAGDLALKNNVGDKLKPQDVTPGQLLDGAMKKGATAAVCALYLPNTGNKVEDLKEGIAPAKPDVMGKEILEANRKILVF